MNIEKFEDHTKRNLPEAERGKLIYLATPYSHPDPRVMRWRFRAAARIAGALMKMGYRVFCPISHTVPVEDECMFLPTDPMWWVEQVDDIFVEKCDMLVIGALPGWGQSKGVNAEMVQFDEDEKPSFVLRVRDLFNETEWEKLGGTATD